MPCLAPLAFLARCSIPQQHRSELTVSKYPIKLVMQLGQAEPSYLHIDQTERLSIFLTIKGLLLDRHAPVRTEIAYSRGTLCPPKTSAHLLLSEAEANLVAT